MRLIFHGHTTGTRGNTVRSPTYNSWRSMVSRCTCPSDTAYRQYGAKGVTVCDRWRSFPDFLADMGERPEGLTLDRIDNAKGYEPGNCRWATRTVQTFNRTNTRLIAARGERLTVAGWAAKLGRSRKSIENRLYRHGEEGLAAWLMT